MISKIVKNVVLISSLILTTNIKRNVFKCIWEFLFPSCCFQRVKIFDKKNAASANLVFDPSAVINGKVGQDV